MKWKPIETAPKDGTEILLYLPKVNNVISGNWSSNSGCWIDCWCAKKDSDCYLPSHWAELSKPTESETP
jgi:hypothetical protein